MSLEDINASIRELEARLLIQEIERAGIEGASSMLHSTPASAKALRPPRQSDSGFTTMQSVGESAEKGTALSNQGSASKQKSVHFANKTQRTPQGKPDSDDIRNDLSKYLHRDDQSRSDPDTNITVRRKRERSQNEPTHEKSAVKIEPATYDGTSSWLDYKSHFEACAKLGNWNEEREGALPFRLTERSRSGYSWEPEHRTNSSITNSWYVLSVIGLPHPIKWSFIGFS